MSQTEKWPTALEIQGRIFGVDVGKFYVDKPKVEAAMAGHLRQLDMSPLPVRWVDGGDAFWGAARAAWAAWAVRDVRAARAAWDVRAARAAWDVRDVRAVRAVRAAEEIIKIWLPFVDAYEAGLWLFWITDKEVVACPRPVMHVVNEQLHNPDGPAVHWPQGEGYFFLHNVQVPPEIVTTPADLLDPRLILKEPNAEVRREIVRKVGVDRVVSRLGGKTLETWGNYSLVSLDLGDGRHRPYLKMLNVSIGTWHVEGVHPDCRTIEAALKWRNGTKEMPTVVT